MAVTEGAPARDGNQTLARGLRVMLAIADTAEGLSVQQVADLLEVHRSIAYRLLQTLTDFGLITRLSTGAYVPGARLATMAQSFLPALRDVAQPVMRLLADELRSTLSLFVQQGDEAVAISMVEPTTASHHLAFRLGMRTPLTRGAAGYALLAARAPRPDEPREVTLAREQGIARSSGEVEAGQHAVAAWIPRPALPAPATLTLITFRQEVADRAGPQLRAAARRIADALAI